MGGKIDFEAIPVGMELNPTEMILEEETLSDRADLVQWNNRSHLENLGMSVPGLTIVHHAKMQFDTFQDLSVGIWAKSEHEFIKPMKVGSKVFIRGKIVEKYTKRGRNYIVAEFNTTDEKGETLMRSRETSLFVE